MTWHTPVWHWLTHAALGSLILLAVGGLAVRLCREPARKIRLIELTLLGCLLSPWVGGLALLPQWRLGWLDTPAPEPAPPPAAGETVATGPGTARQEAPAPEPTDQIGPV